MSETGFPRPDLFTRRCGVIHSADFFCMYSLRTGCLVLAEGPVAPSHVRDHSCRFFVIAVTYQCGLAQFFLALLCLGRQDVTQPRLVTQDLSRPGFLEALGSAFVRF